MNSVECLSQRHGRGQVLQRISLSELKRIVRLRLDVNPHDLKPGPCITDRSSSRPTKQIENPWLSP